MLFRSHGKTSLVKKMCEQEFDSNMNVESCTCGIDMGLTKKHAVWVMGTPRFCASGDIASHLEAQKNAIELTELSGVLLTVKHE